MVALALSLLLAGTPVPTAEPAAPDLVKLLGSEDYKVRHKAFEDLLRLGESATGALTEARSSPDPEIRLRARYLVELIKWSVPPGLAPKLGVLLYEFDKQPVAERERIAADVAFLGGKDAIPVLRKILRNDPEKSVQIAAARGLVLQPEGMEVLIQEGVPAVGLAAYDVSVLMHLGNSYLERSEYDKALEQYNRILSLEPKNPTAFYNIACTHSRQKKTKEALDALRKACEYGFNDFEWMQKDPDLDNIRSLPEFQNIVDEYKK